MADYSPISVLFSMPITRSTIDRHVRCPRHETNGSLSQYIRIVSGVTPSQETAIRSCRETQCCTKLCLDINYKSSILAMMAVQLSGYMACFVERSSIDFPHKRLPTANKTGYMLSNQLADITLPQYLFFPERTDVHGFISIIPRFFHGYFRLNPTHLVPENRLRPENSPSFMLSTAVGAAYCAVLKLYPWKYRRWQSLPLLYSGFMAIYFYRFSMKVHTYQTMMFKLRNPFKDWEDGLSYIKRNDMILLMQGSEPTLRAPNQHMRTITEDHSKLLIIDNYRQVMELIRKSAYYYTYFTAPEVFSDFAGLHHFRAKESGHMYVGMLTRHNFTKQSSGISYGLQCLIETGIFDFLHRNRGNATSVGEMPVQTRKTVDLTSFAAGVVTIAVGLIASTAASMAEIVSM